MMNMRVIRDKFLSSKFVNMTDKQEDQMVPMVPTEPVVSLPKATNLPIPKPAPKGPLADMVSSSDKQRKNLAAFAESLESLQLTDAVIEESMKDVKQLQVDYTEMLNLFSSIRKNFANRLEAIRKARAKRTKGE